MTVRMQYHRPYKGWSNELTFTIFSVACSTPGFSEEYAKSRHILARPRDLMLFCKKHLGDSFLLPPDVWRGAVNKVDWDQLCGKWDAPGVYDLQKQQRVKGGRVRKSTVKKYLEERILGFSTHKGPIFETFAVSPSADFKDSYALGTCFGMPVVYWCPYFKLAAVRVEDAIHGAGIMLAQAALDRFFSSNTLSISRGTPVDRIIVSAETEEGVVEGRVSNFIQVFLDDGSFASRTYFAKKECDDVYELCLNSPATVAQELSR